MNIRRLILTAVLGFPAIARAELPPCLSHLEHAPSGGVLSAHQNDVNNNCLRELQIASVASDLAARIAESERKQHPPATVTGPGASIAMNNAPSFAQGGPPLAPMIAPPTSTPVPAAAVTSSAPAPVPLPRIVMIVSDGARYLATLRLADGNSIDAVTGTVLPDGNKIAAVTAGSVYVRRDKTLVPLTDDDGSNATVQARASSRPDVTIAPNGFIPGRPFP